MKCGVYLLKFEGGKTYLGSTNDFDRRLVQHRLGMVRSTKRFGQFVQVVGFQVCLNLREARQLERKYKAWKNSTKVLLAMKV